MSKAKRKIFINWPRNQRRTTVAMPYPASACAYGPVATPSGREELRDIQTPTAFAIRDADALL